MTRSNPAPLITSRGLTLPVLVCSGLIVSSCGTINNRADQVQSTPPTVTYEYSNDQSLVDAALRAEEYCLEFNAWPSTAGVYPPVEGEITFICEQERNVRYPDQQLEVLSDPTIRYSYNDQATLVKATNRAQRHCARFGARARSVTLSDDGGTRTVVFECIR